MATDTYFSKPGLTPERADFYARLGERGTAPLWEVLGKLVAPEPRPQTQPVLWQYDTLRDFPTLNGVEGKGGSIESHSVFAGAGMLFVGSGYGQFSQAPGNVLLAFRPKGK